METVKAAPDTASQAEPRPVISPAGGVAIGTIVLGLELSLLVYLFVTHGPY